MTKNLKRLIKEAEHRRKENRRLQEAFRKVIKFEHNNKKKYGFCWGVFTVPELCKQLERLIQEANSIPVLTG